MIDKSKFKQVGINNDEYRSFVSNIIMLANTSFRQFEHLSILKDDDDYLIIVDLLAIYSIKDGWRSGITGETISVVMEVVKQLAAIDNSREINRIKEINDKFTNLYLTG